MSEPTPVLQPFDASDAPTVSSWATSEAEVRAWCGEKRVPVPPDVIAGWGRADGVQPYVLTEHDRLVAYGELWVDDHEREVEVARLVVDPSRRGRSLGRRLAALLAERARRLHPSVFLRVHADNAAALRCYAAAGFERVPEDVEARWNREQPVRYVWMRYA